MIGLVAAIREVYKNPNHVLGTAVTEKYFTADETTTTGDVFRLARNQVNRDALAILDGGRRDSSNIINTACYNFLGDPEIPLYIPAEKVRLTSVNGSTGGKATVSPLQKFNITGEAGPQGSADETFNGELTIAIYDAPSRPTQPQPKTGETSHTPSRSTKDVIFECACGGARRASRHDSPHPTRPGTLPGVSNRVNLCSHPHGHAARNGSLRRSHREPTSPKAMTKAFTKRPEITPPTSTTRRSTLRRQNLRPPHRLFDTVCAAGRRHALAGNSSLLGAEP